MPEIIPLSTDKTSLRKNRAKKNLFVTQYARFIKGLTRSSTKAHAQVTKREKNTKHQKPNLHVHVHPVERSRSDVCQ